MILSHNQSLKDCPKHPCKIDIPFALSFLATNDFEGYVPGINDIINGYTNNEGVKEPSLQEKIARGKQAITALPAYREAKKLTTKQVLKLILRY